jgi:hypothetical protein
MRDSLPPPRRGAQAKKRVVGRRSLDDLRRGCGDRIATALSARAKIFEHPRHPRSASARASRPRPRRRTSQGQFVSRLERLRHGKPDLASSASPAALSREYANDPPCARRRRAIWRGGAHRAGAGVIGRNGGAPANARSAARVGTDDTRPRRLPPRGSTIRRRRGGGGRSTDRATASTAACAAV